MMTGHTHTNCRNERKPGNTFSSQSKQYIYIYMYMCINKYGKYVNIHPEKTSSPKPLFIKTKFILHTKIKYVQCTPLHIHRDYNFIYTYILHTLYIYIYIYTEYILLCTLYSLHITLTL